MFALLLLAAVPQAFGGCPPDDTACSNVEMPAEANMPIGVPAKHASESKEPPPPSLEPELAERFRKIEEIRNKPRPPDAGEVLYAQLTHFRGKSARYAFDRLGYPDKKIVIDGASVYSWLNETNNLDGSPLRCTVKVVVRAAKIVSTDFFGNNGACARFARALDPAFSADY